MQQIKSLISNPKVGSVIRILPGIFFMASGIAKIISPAEFGKVITSYQIVPYVWVVTLTLVIPYLEFIIGMALVINLYPKTISVLAMLMLVVFTAVSEYRYITGDVSDCGCFGKILQRKNDWTLLAENSILMFFLTIQIVSIKQKGKEE